MPGVASALEDKHHNLGIGNARRVSVISTKDRTRAIVNLTQLVSYDTDVRGNTLYLMVGGDASGVPSLREYASAGDTSSSERYSGDSRVNNVDFRRGSNGEGMIIVELSNPKAPD